MAATSRLERALIHIEDERGYRNAGITLYRQSNGFWEVSGSWRGQHIYGRGLMLTSAAENWLEVVERIKAAME